MTNYTQKYLNDIPYWERLHNHANPEDTLVIIMHWMTGSAEAMSFVFEDVSFPLREIALQGTHPTGLPEGGYSWFERETDFYEKLSDAEQAPLIRKEVDRVAQFIQDIRQHHSGKIAVTGMSQGGDMSLHLATYYPELIDLALPMAGRLSEPMRPDNLTHDSLPTVSVLQGLDDEIVLAETARDVAQWLKEAGYNSTLHEYPDVGHSISQDMIDYIRKTIKAL